MAGMLPGVEAARRRRFHISHGPEPEASPTSSSSARRLSFCLYAPTHDSSHSLVRSNPISHKELYDESKLNTAAREAKKRLDQRLQSQTKRHSSSECMMKNKAGIQSPKSKGNGMSWMRSRRRLSEEEECAVCLEALKSRRGGTLMQLACGHRFHNDCLLPWLEGNARCPCCRMPTHLSFTTTDLNEINNL